MAKLYDAKTGEPIEVPNEKVHEYVLSKKYKLEPKSLVPLALDSGTIFELSAEDAEIAFKMGLRYAPHAAWEKAKADKQYGSGFENAALAAGLGLGAGATLSLSNAAAVGSGLLSPYALEALKEHHPIPYYSSEVLGFLGVSLATAGVGPAAAATGTAVRVATGSVVGGTAANLLARETVKRTVGQKIVGAYGQVAGGGIARDVGRYAGEKILLKGVSSTGRMRAARVGQMVAEGAVDTALWQVGEKISEATVNHVTGSPQKSAGTILGEVTLGTLVGGFGSGAAGAIWHGFGHNKDKIRDGALSLYSARYGDPKNPSKGHDLLAKRLVKQQGEEAGTIAERTEELAMTPEGATRRKDVDEEIVEYQTLMLQMDEAHNKLSKDHAALSAAAETDLFKAQTLVDEFARAEEALILHLEKIDPDVARVTADNLIKSKELGLTDSITWTKSQIELRLADLAPARKMVAEQAEQAQKNFDKVSSGLGADFKTETDKLLDVEDPTAVVGATQTHLDVTEEIQRATQGESKIDALADLMVPGGGSGESRMGSTFGADTEDYAHDVIETMHTKLDELRQTIEQKRKDRLYDSEGEIDKVLGQIDDVEERIVKRFEDIYQIETKPTSRTAAQIDASSTAAVNAQYNTLGEQAAPAIPKRKLKELLSKESVANAQVTPELDTDLKKALFGELDNLRKDLSSVIFDRAAINQLDFNQRGLLKDVWQEIRDLQSHKSFGEAGKRLSELNGAWKEMMEARSAYSALFGSTKAKGGKNFVDPDKAQKLVLKTMQKHTSPGKAALDNIRVVQARFLNSVNSFARHSSNLGLIKEDAVNRLAASRHRLDEINSASDELSNLKHLLSEVKGNQDLDYNEVLRRAREGGAEAPFADLMADKAQKSGDYVNPELQDKIDTLERKIFNHKKDMLGFKTTQGEAAADRVNLEGDVARYVDETAPRRETLESLKEQLVEAKARAARTLADTTAETKSASLDRNIELTEKAKEATDVKIPRNYIPQLPNNTKSTLGDMRTHGTTSIPGLLAFQAAGWQGSAAASIGATGFLKAILMKANPEEQYLRRLRTYDILQRGVSDRKKIVRESLEGKLKKVADKNLVNPLQKILAVVAGKGRLDPLLGNDDKSDLDAATSRLDEIQANPSMKAELLDQAVKGFADDMPETAQALQIKISTILDYVQSVVPRGPASALTAINPQPYEPPDSELYKFERHVAMATNWKSALTNGLASYSITPGEVEAFQTCYPEIFEDIIADYYEARKNITKRIPREISLAWTTIIGIQNDPTMTPQFMTTVAKSFAAGQPAQPNPQSAALKQVPQSHMTPSQMRYT